VTRRTALAAPLAALAMLAAAPAAHGQGAVVQAANGPPEAPANFQWLPRDVTIKAGETVTWRFENADGLHNVISQGGNWSYRSGTFQEKHPPASFAFSTPGVYKFVCEVHVSTMFGTVTVTDASGTPPPPPPPPPPSEQPFPNDQSAPAFDVLRPVVSRVRATARRRGARVRFRLSEAARVTIRVKRGPITVARRAVNRRRGTHRVTIRGLRAARYRIEVLAIDLAGNRSRVSRSQVRIR
jgi:plastocyanin